MSEVEYKVGLIAKPTGHVHFLFQGSNLTQEADVYEAKDENGNTVATQHINHRVKISIDAIMAAGASVPSAGQTIMLTGLKLPTVDASGNVTGTFGVDPTATEPIAFKVDGSPSITQSNTDYVKASFEAVRHLVNGLPTA